MWIGCLNADHVVVDLVRYFENGSNLLGGRYRALVG